MTEESVLTAPGIISIFVAEGENIVVGEDMAGRMIPIAAARETSIYSLLDAPSEQCRSYPITKPTQSGFTLIELLAALAITALALALAVPTISDSLTRTTVIARETEAATLTEAVLARVGQDIPLAKSQTDGHDGDADWTVAVTPWAGQDDPATHANVTVYRVVATVRWLGRRRPQTIELVTLRLAPGS